jgi:hypothetical protein
MTRIQTHAASKSGAYLPLSSLRDRAAARLAGSRLNRAQDYDSALILLALIQAPTWVFLAWRYFS